MEALKKKLEQVSPYLDEKQRRLIYAAEAIQLGRGGGNRNNRKCSTFMIFPRTVTDYWFTIEPYVYVSIANSCTLLYNTPDGIFIESEKIKVVELLKETLLKENCGVALLTNERFKQKEIDKGKS